MILLIFFDCGIMVYKKFVKRGGKVFGPYYYESYRDEKGKVLKKYLGTVNPNDVKKRVGPTSKGSLFVLGALLLLSLIVGFY